MKIFIVVVASAIGEIFLNLIFSFPIPFTVSLIIFLFLHGFTHKIGINGIIGGIIFYDGVRGELLGLNTLALFVLLGVIFLSATFIQFDSRRTSTVFYGTLFLVIYEFLLYAIENLFVYTGFVSRDYSSFPHTVFVGTLILESIVVFVIFIHVFPFIKRKLHFKSFKRHADFRFSK